MIKYKKKMKFDLSLERIMICLFKLILLNILARKY